MDVGYKKCVAKDNLLSVIIKYKTKWLVTKIKNIIMKYWFCPS